MAIPAGSSLIPNFHREQPRGLQLANEKLGQRSVKAVIITHSHADHFAGVLGVVTHEQVASGEVAMVAPEAFVDEALSENVLAGNVMNRRATYMYGNLLKPSETGFITTGLGAALSMAAQVLLCLTTSLRKPVKPET